MTKLSKPAVLNFERHIHTVCLLKQFLISDLVKPVDIADPVKATVMKDISSS